MHIHCKLVMLILALTLDGQAHTGKIIGGHQAVPHSRPYMVLLKRHMPNGGISYCSGFLLNEDFVMTAAHCQTWSYTVLLGLHNINKEIQNIPVERTFPHKDFNETNYKNDIMLLKLRSKATFSKNVKPITLADQGDDSLPKSCVVSGWGRTDTSLISHVLMEVNVTLVANMKCEHENLYCSEGETGPGEGDSGSPLVCEDWKAYGVVSFYIQPNSDEPKIYTFTKIPEYRNWIDSTIKDAWNTPLDI